MVSAFRRRGGFEAGGRIRLAARPVLVARRWEYLMGMKRVLVLGVAIVAAVFSALGAVGCSTGRARSPWPAPRPLGRGIASFRPGQEPRVPQPEPVRVEEPTGVLTLRRALAAALARNPELAAVSWQIRAAEAQALQAGRGPNPEVRVQMAEFGGSGRFEGTKESDQMIRLSQVIELGAKASKRREVARFEAAMCGWDYETTRLDVFAQTAKAFVSVLSADKRLSTAEEMYRLAQATMATVAKRVKAGAMSPLDAAQVRVEVGATRIELAQAKRAKVAARGVLAGCWGGKQPKFESAAGDIEALFNIPALEELLPQVSGNPDVARWETETNLRKAAIVLEEANRIPDLRVLVGTRRVQDTHDYGHRVALEVSLPVFDRNQDALARARFNRVRAAYQRQAAIMTAQGDLHLAYQALSASHEEVAALRKEILPAANDRVETADKALGIGAVTHLQVMKARRAMFKERIRLIEALEEFHTAVVDVERLISRPIGPPR